MMKEIKGKNQWYFSKKIVSGLLVAALVATAIFVSYNVSYKVYADAGADRTVDTNVEVQFDASNSRGENLNYTWFFYDGSLEYGMTPVFTFEDEGIFEIRLLVSDSHGNSDTDTVKITVHNVYPEASSGIDKWVYEDELVTFNAAGTVDTPPDMSTLIYSWDFGDDSFANGIEVSHTYTISGQYTVILNVTDNDGAIDRDIIVVSVENLPPCADAGLDQTIYEDDIVYFDGGSSTDSPSDLSTLVYSWDFGDGSMGAGDKTTHVYTKAGTYTVTLTVTDDDGAMATDIMVVTTNNVLPMADAGEDQIVSEDQIVFFSGLGKDTESDEPQLSYYWDFGDGTVGFGKYPVHTYQEKGIYTVTLKVTDDDGGVGQDTMKVTVTNDQPIVDAGPDMEVNEDILVQFRGYSYDTPSDEQFLKYSWDFGDGNTGSGPNPTHTYTNQGTYTVTLTVIDDDSFTGKDSLIVKVKNIPPSAQATYTCSYPVILTGDIITFNGEASDSISDQFTLTYFWDFGDGTTAFGSSVTHIYFSEGIYEVILTVTDDDGATAQDVIIILVERHTMELEIISLVDEVMPGEKAEYVITLKNTGTIDDSFNLELSTSIDPLWIDFVDTHVEVAAKSIVKVILEIMLPEDFPLDYDVTFGFKVAATCVHQDSELSNAPLMDSVSHDIMVIATYESRMRWAQVEVEGLITDFSGDNPTDASLLKALEEISEALFFASTMESLEFDYVKSFEHVKEGIHNLEMVNDSVATDYIVDLLLIAVNDEVRDTIITAEIQAGADNIHVIDAWSLYYEARSKITSGDYENGIERYKSAYMEAERAEGEWVPREYKSALLQAIDDIEILLAGPYSAEAKNELQQAKEELQEAINKSGQGLLQDSFVNVKNAVEHLQDAEGYGAPSGSIVVLLTEAIENTVEMLITETETHVGMEVNDIKQAWLKFYKGQEFASKGQYLQAIDKYDRAYTHALNAEDWIPIADAGPDQVVIEDEITYFDASNSRDRDGIVLFYEWDFGDGGKDIGIFVNHIYKDQGVYNVTLLITDNKDEMDIDIMVVTMGNEAPDADLVLDYLPCEALSSSNTVYMDELVLFDALYSDTPSDLPNLVFHWNFGDDTTEYGAHAEHVYTFPGTYEVVLTVTDEDGETGTDTATIIVKNVIPTASITYSQIAYEDEIVYLSGFGSDSPSHIKTLTYTWDFGDGSSGIGKDVTHLYKNEGIYTVTLYDTDNYGDVGISTVTVSVINSPPLADAGWIKYIQEDNVLNFIGSSLDTPSDSALLTYDWDFGDNTKASGAFQSHTYTKAGAYTVTLTVTDDNGDIHSDRIMVFIENVKPTANAGNDQTVNEDDVVSFTGSGSDTSSDNSYLTYYWDFGDGSTGSGMNPTNVYNQAGTYSVTMTVMDDDGSWDTDTMTVTVNNAIPMVNAGSDQVVKEDELVLFTGSALDTPSDMPQLTYEWDFGDGNMGYGRCPVHSYIDEGTYTVSLTITDDDGVKHVDTMNVEVKNVAPSAMAGPDLIIYSNPVYLNFVGRGFDTPSDQSSLTYSWDFDDSDGIKQEATGKYVDHLFEFSGVYTVTLTVTDDDDATATDTAVIVIILDSDGDGLPDWWEIKYGLDPFDANGDNGTFGDPDNDALTNIWEYYYRTDPMDPDTDDDSYKNNFKDGAEIAYWLARGIPQSEVGKNANTWDYDTDGMPDGWEVYHSLDPDDYWGIHGATGDPDGDGLLNFYEYYNPYDVDSNPHTNPRNPDTDGDGMNDSWESYFRLDPTDSTDEHGADGDPDEDGLTNINEYINPYDTDGITYTDPREKDTDNDGMWDGWECENDLDPTDPTGLNGPAGDLEPDELCNLKEYSNPYDTDGDTNTDPRDSDTDGDNLPDYWETTHRLDPTDSSGENGADEDPDADGLSNLEEFQAGSNPRDPDSDSDFIIDGKDPNPVLYNIYNKSGEIIYADVVLVNETHGVSIAIDYPYETLTPLPTIEISNVQDHNLNGIIGNKLNISSSANSYEVAVKIRYDETTINTDERYLLMYYFDGYEWTLFKHDKLGEDTWRDTDNNYVWAEGSHLGHIAIADSTQNDLDRDVGGGSSYYGTDGEELNVAEYDPLIDILWDSTLTEYKTSWDLIYGPGGDDKTLYVKIPVDEGSFELVEAGAHMDLTAGKGFGEFAIGPTGEAAEDWYGVDVSNLGDVNGDNIDDFIVGAHYNDGNGENSGGAYIYYGGTSLDATSDLTINGKKKWCLFGISVSYVGDINKDGYNDVIIGEPWNSDNKKEGGRAYIYHGNSPMDGSADVTLKGNRKLGWFGDAVSYAGDVNGDGNVDVIVGEPTDVSHSDQKGKAYIFHGGSSMDSSADVTLTGEFNKDSFGKSVSYAGDVNKDGYDDVIVGAYLYNGGVGKAYIYYGGPGMDATADVTMTVSERAWLGWSVSNAGDVNGDGYDDVIVGGYQAGRSGKAFIYYGGDPMTGGVDVTLEGENNGDSFGVSVSYAGDLNNDGYDDVIVGAMTNDEANTNAGKVYIYFGGSSMDSEPDIEITGDLAEGRYGKSVSFAGDVDNDGYEDIIVGAYQNSAVGDDAGKAYVYTNIYPEDTYLDIRNDGVKDWSKTGIFETSTTIDDSNGKLTENLNNVLAGMQSQKLAGGYDAHTGDVAIPLKFHSSSAGRIQVSDIYILVEPVISASKDVLRLDSDGDGLSDIAEEYWYFNPTYFNCSLLVTSEPWNCVDSDGDGLWDGEEVFTYFSNPRFTNSDLDWLTDYEEAMSYGTHPMLEDTDGDGLYDDQEDSNGNAIYDEGSETDPNNPDTDGDGIIDSVDASPLSMAAMEWTDIYEPGMVRFTQEYTVFGLRGESEIFEHHYNWFGEHTGKTRTYGPGKDGIDDSEINDETVEEKIEEYFPDYDVIDVKSNGLSGSTSTWKSWGGDGWHRNEYKITYYIEDYSYEISLKNKNPVTVPTSGWNYHYDLSKISVKLGIDQSIFIQFSIKPEADLTAISDDGNSYTLPGFVYRLYKNNDFVNTESCFEYVGIGGSIGENAYQAEIKIPKEYATTGNTIIENGVRKMYLYLSPVWMMKSSGEDRRFGMNPEYMKIGSIIKNIPENSFTVIAKLGVNATAIREEIEKVDIKTYSGYHDFGSGTNQVKVYIHNDWNDDIANFDQNAITDPSVDAIVIVSGTSLEAKVYIDNDINWNEEWEKEAEDAWENVIETYNTAVSALQTTFDYTKVGGHGWDYRPGDTQTTTWGKPKNKITVQCLEIDGQKKFKLTRTMKYEAFEDVGNGVIKKEIKTYTDHEEVEDLADSKFLSQRYRGLNNVFSALSVGSIIVTDGRDLAIAAWEGDHVKLVKYAATTTIKLSKEFVDIVTNNWPDSKLGTKLGGKASKIGTAATIALGGIEAGYNIYLASQTDSEILKRSYYEDAAAACIDTGISLIPIYGEVIESSWSVTIMVFSYIMPNDLAQDVCSSPGSAIVFLCEYFDSHGTVPSQFAKRGLDHACQTAVDIYNDFIELGIPSVLILPETAQQG